MAESPILQAVLEVKESESRAEKYYADAATNTPNPMGKKLFEQLAQFENYHFQKLASLEENLRLREAFIKYERHEIPSTLRLVPSTGNAQDQEGVIQIIRQALDDESSAEKVYLHLADMISDPDGHYMFSRLSEEEHLHFHVLKEAFWSLTHTGIWEWTLH